MTLPFSPTNSLVVIDQSRLAPSSCELDVRILSGQFGHTRFLSSFSGGCGINSNCVILNAPWRFDVPTQSEPVSPPPITTTCLLVAMTWFSMVSPATTLFCGVKKSIAYITPSNSRPLAGKSRGVSAPAVKMTASNSLSKSSALTLFNSEPPTC